MVSSLVKSCDRCTRDSTVFAQKEKIEKKLSIVIKEQPILNILSDAGLIGEGRTI